MKDLQKFLLSQKVIAIASHDKNIWIANVYYGTDENLNIYFISSLESKHCQQILKNPQVAFSLAWYDEKSFSNREGIQGIGKCTLVEDKTEIKLGVSLHNKNYPEFSARITEEFINSPDNNLKVWKIRPIKMKHWNDKLYGDQKFKEFDF